MQKAQPVFRVAPARFGGRQIYFDSEIAAARNWLSARMPIDCLLPAVRSEMLALKPAVLAITSKLPPPPRPCRVPLTPRAASLQVPDTAPPWSTILAESENL